MNITLSVDERVVEGARDAARLMGKSLNQVIREHLERLAGRDQERLQREAEAFVQSCLNTEGRRNGWKFDREGANARR
jgi:hypothetical protein